MPKVILEFNLPEDRHDYEAAINGTKWALALWDLNEQFRQWDKYDKEFKSVRDVLAACRAEIQLALDEYNLHFE